jgi:hypothetical protein
LLADVKRGNAQLSTVIFISMPISQQESVKIGCEASTAIGNAMVEWIAARAKVKGEDKRELLVIVGRSLLVEGCSMIGNSIEIDFDQSIAVARKAMAEFKQIALEKKMAIMRSHLEQPEEEPGQEPPQ